MYFTDDSLLPENQEPLIICVAPYGPEWLPDDFPEDIPLTFEEQVQKAVDCYNAGATLIHLHVRDPKTGHGSEKPSGIQRPDRAHPQGRAQAADPSGRLDFVCAAGGRRQGQMARL